MGGIRISLEVFNVPVGFFKFLSTEFVVRSHQAEIPSVNRLIHGHNIVTRMLVEPKLFDQGRREKDVFTLPAALLTNVLKKMFSGRNVVKNVF